ncbi:MAG TPA: oxidoreductase [Nocardioidaceae bacterium]|nr:oxidoreductase [Nocardioidaceae bacterium]
MSGRSWTTVDIPDLTGQRALVTGVTGGLGYHVVRELARAGAEVMATARDRSRGKASLDAIRSEVPTARVELLELDLADLESVRSAASTVVGDGRPLDICVNNAGVMAAPERRTVDGFELQIGTNHLGHFALVGQLWPALVAARAARVVAVSSLMHWLVRGIELRRLEPESRIGRYRKWTAYSESKLANLVYALELDRRAGAAGAPVVSVAAHPGYSATGLQHAGLAMGNHSVQRFVLRLGNVVLAQSAEAGAWPLLRAATEPDLPGGSYMGPGSLGESRGAPTPARISRRAADTELGRCLWDASESATGVTYP